MSYRDARLTAYGLEPWTDEDDQNPDRPETVLKREILRLKLPSFAMHEPVGEFKTRLRSTITTTTEWTEFVDADFNNGAALVIKATPTVIMATHASLLEVNLDQVEAEISINRGGGPRLTNGAQNSTDNVNAIPLTALADGLLLYDVRAQDKLSVRFRSAYATAGASNIAESVIVTLTLHWNRAP